jgi:hypothetical protein
VDADLDAVMQQQRSPRRSHQANECSSLVLRTIHEVWCCCSPLQHALQRRLIHCAQMIHNAHGLQSHKLRRTIGHWRCSVLCATLAHIQRVHACCATSYGTRWHACMPQLSAVQRFALWITLRQPTTSVRRLQASVPLPLRCTHSTLSVLLQSLDSPSSAKPQDSRAPRSESS